MYDYSWAETIEAAEAAFLPLQESLKTTERTSVRLDFLEFPLNRHNFKERY